MFSGYKELKIISDVLFKPVECLNNFISFKIFQEIDHNLLWSCSLFPLGRLSNETNWHIRNEGCNFEKKTPSLSYFHLHTWTISLLRLRKQNVLFCFNEVQAFRIRLNASLWWFILEYKLYSLFCYWFYFWCVEWIARQVR